MSSKHSKCKDTSANQIHHITVEHKVKNTRNRHLTPLVLCLVGGLDVYLSGRVKCSARKVKTRTILVCLPFSHYYLGDKVT